MFDFYMGLPHMYLKTKYTMCECVHMMCVCVCVCECIHVHVFKCVHVCVCYMHVWQSLSLTGFIVTKYFSLKMASFSALLRYCMAMVRLISWSICIRRLEEDGRGEGMGGGQREADREGQREGEREGEKGGGRSIIQLFCNSANKHKTFFQCQMTYTPMNFTLALHKSS